MSRVNLWVSSDNYELIDCFICIIDVQMAEEAEREPEFSLPALASGSQLESSLTGNRFNKAWVIISSRFRPARLPARTRV